MVVFRLRSKVLWEKSDPEYKKQIIFRPTLTQPITDDERNDLLELRAFLEKAILLVNEEIIHFPHDGKKRDYRFLTNKAVMYRDNLRTVVELLKTDEDQ